MLKTKIFLKSFVTVLGSTLIGMMLASTADAANPEPVVVDVEFVAPIQITATNSLDFGLLDENLVIPEFIIVAPDSSLTDASSRVVGPAPIAANLTIIAAPARPITIDVNLIANGTYYTLGAFMCNYDGALVDSACDGAGYGETSVAGPTALFVGVTLTGVIGGAAAGLDPGSFEVTITYN